MAAIRVKSGAGWTAPIANGKLNVKWGGTTWQNPSVVYAKAGDVGGGYWVDTGYRGYPATPSAPWVHAWSYDAIALGWNAGGGGAPVAAYQLVQTDVNGNWINQVEVGGSPWGNFGMGWDSRYQFYVRAKATSGLYSGFAGPLRVGCGHPTQYQYGNVQHSEGWQEYNAVGGDAYSWGYRDNFVGQRPGGDVHVEYIYWNLSANVGVLSPWNNREVYIIGNDSALYWGPMGWNRPVVGYDYFDFWGNGGVTGFVCRGSGWSTQFNNNGYPRVTGEFWVGGTRYWTAYEVVNTINEQGNYYW